MTNRIIKTYDVSTGQTLVAIEDLIVAQTAATSLARQVSDLTTDLAETERERVRLLALERNTAEQLRAVTIERDRLRDFIRAVATTAEAAARPFVAAVTSSAKSLGIDMEGLW
ncbi:hypothetical protein BOWSER_55 [Gordonia phage Bowser]|uniref:Uncharacterized protein n=1 Tax=Gordonia phage Bowser TaxID=1838063 RepID=A0A160DCP8_9CAUD|nr:hypothetical protein BH770_gp55 [Gordonia phage Bowser]ANA85450.1 hypothetical protein BOWSER_55 [Gordonia phage Bowser]